MKKQNIKIILYLVLGVFLASTTLSYLSFISSASKSETVGWLGFSGISAGLIIPLLFMFTVDLFWIVYAVLWLIRKIMHIKSDDNTLYFP